MSKFLEQLVCLDTNQRKAGEPHISITTLSGEVSDFTREVYSVYKISIDWEKKIRIADGKDKKQDLNYAFQTVKQGLAEDIFSEFRPMIRELKLMILEGKFKEAKHKVDELLEMTYPK